ncbi:hypothetical protein N9C31_00400 [Gammaproteobacteria bacterium]|nr:hypothetical protein [Gammaproteobacteria bacterium]
MGQVALFFSGISVSFMGVGQALIGIIAVTGSRLTAYLSEPLAYLFSNIEKLGHLHRISQTAFVRPVKLKILKSDSQFWKEDIVKKFLGIDEQGLMEKSKVRVGQYLQEHESNQDINTVLTKLNEHISGIADFAQREQYHEISKKISDTCESLDGSQQKHFAYLLAKYVDWLKDNPGALDDLFKDVGVCASGLLTNIANIVGSVSGNMMQSYVFWRQCKSTEITYDDIKEGVAFWDFFLSSYLRDIVKQNSTQLLGRGTNTNYEVHSTNFKKALFDPSAAKSLIASDGTLSMLLDSQPGFMIWNAASLFYSQPIESLLAKSIFYDRYDETTGFSTKVNSGAFYNEESLQSGNTWNELDKRLVEIMKRNDSTFSLDKLKILQWELLEPHINTEHRDYDVIKQWFEEHNLIKAFDTAFQFGALREQDDFQKIYRQVLLPFVLLDLMDSGIMLRLGDHGGALSGPQEIASTKFNWIKTCSYGAWLWLRIPLWIAKDVVRYALSMIWELSVSVAQTVTGQKKTNLSFMGVFKNLIHHAALYAGMSVLMVNDLFFGTLYCSGMMLKMAAQCLFVTVFFGLKLPVKMMEGFYQVNYDLVLGLSQMVRSVVFSNDAQSKSINQAGNDTAKNPYSLEPGKGV